MPTRPRDGRPSDADLVSLVEPAGGMSALAILERFVGLGFAERPVQLAIQGALNRKALELGPRLHLYVPRSAVA